MEPRLVDLASGGSQEDGIRWLMKKLGYDEILALRPDPRVQDWFLMSSPWPTLAICATYIFLVKILGPWFMRNRPPFELRVPLVVHSGCQTLFSLWLLSSTFQVGWFRTYSFTCQPVDYSISEHALMVAGICWYYFMSKFVEFFDTFFFVLRKKTSHVSFLHAFHHGIMPIACWVLVKYVAGGHTTFEGMLNTFVHVIMYFYYMVAAMGPKYDRFIWWKKYLTLIQVTQFAITTVHNCQLLFFVDCNYPKPFALLLFLNSVTFFGLFLNFYVKSYKRSSAKMISTFVVKSIEKANLRKDNQFESHRQIKGAWVKNE